MFKRRVAIYARVSSDKEAQLYALENQKQYYEDILERKQNWVLHKMYVDEGLSGTMTKKRVNFLQMIEDAKTGMFDLIITREVSRFARNTVDTLLYTRELRKYGVEVYFIEDNIWTLNDEDGELKLTLMATLAQNESKKISVRAKAGQHISFLNGVMYGNGNILGYDRVGRDLIINERQAEIVRTIFELYNSGDGFRKISFELERRGYLTSSGSTKWQPGTISHIIQNPFYCGKIVYRKSYVQDYLEHKAVPNRGEVEQVIIEGKHQPIISVETFDKAQAILKTKISHQRNIGRGLKPSSDVWVRKVRCCCGRTMARRMWHRKKEDGSGQLTYRCRSQMETGSIKTRKNQGLDTEGICDTPWVQRWKLEVMLHVLFKHLWQYRDIIIDNAMSALSEVFESNEVQVVDVKKQLDGYEKQLDQLLDLYLDGVIVKDRYLEKKDKIENAKKTLQLENKSDKIDNSNSKDKVILRLGNICDIVKKFFNEDNLQIPDEIIDVFVESVVVHKDYFEWRIRCHDEALLLQVSGRKSKYRVSEGVSSDRKNCAVVTCNTGCFEQCRKIAVIAHCKEGSIMLPSFAWCTEGEPLTFESISIIVQIKY